MGDDGILGLLCCPCIVISECASCIPKALEACSSGCCSQTCKGMLGCCSDKGCDFFEKCFSECKDFFGIIGSTFSACFKFCGKSVSVCLCMGASQLQTVANQLEGFNDQLQSVTNLEGIQEAIGVKEVVPDLGDIKVGDMEIYDLEEIQDAGRAVTNLENIQDATQVLPNSQVDALKAGGVVALAVYNEAEEANEANGDQEEPKSKKREKQKKKSR